MNCKWCNREVDASVKFCPYCGVNLINTNVPNVNGTTQVVNPIINQNNNVYEKTTKEEKVNVLLVILSVFIPLAGLIIFLVKKDDDKKTAKASGIAALISFGVSIILSITSVVIFISSANRVINNAFNGTQDIIDDIETELNNNGYGKEDLENAVEDLKDKAEDFFNDTENSNVSNDWNKYEIYLNNQIIKLPCDYSEFSNIAQLEMKSAQELSYISPNYYALVNLYKNDKLALNIELLNDKAEDILYTSAKVTRVSQTQYHVSSGSDVITFPGGLKAGEEITEEEIITLFGTPNDISKYESDGYVSNTYSYFSDTTFTTTNNYKIKVVNGVIDELTLDHRNF